jgi:RNA polymerase primary sigma factor
VEEAKMTKKKTKEQSEDIILTYFEQVKHYPLLTFEEEKELSKRIQKGDETARRRLIEGNLRLVIKIAKSYMVPGVPFLDLVQEGNLGLMHAAGKFNYTHEVRFSTYANWWVRQGILRYLANKRRMIRLPLRKEEMIRKIQKTTQFLRYRLARIPTAGEIAAETGIPLKEINSMLALVKVTAAMDHSEGEASQGIIDYHEDYTYSPEQMFMKKHNRSATLEILNRLKDKEKDILMYRYQFHDNERYTLKKIGDKMGIAPETVRQIEMRALRKMRENAAELAECLA